MSSVKMTQRRLTVDFGDDDPSNDPVTPLDSLGMYSPAHKAVDEWKQPKGSPEQFTAHLKKTAGAHAHAHDIGMLDWLKDKKSVTKDEAKSWLDKNHPKYEEVAQSKLHPKWEVYDSRSSRHNGDLYDSEDEANDAREEWVNGLMEDSPN